MSDIDAPVPEGMSRDDVLITEGDWRIERFSYHIGYYYSIAHYCTAGRPGSALKEWVSMYYHHKFIDPCYVCDRVPPDGIQGAFAMINWDET